jgi:hypothetical protein
MRPRLYTEAKWRKKKFSKNGAALSEFALVAVVFFILFFGIIDISRLRLKYHYVANAAREGTRYAIVHGSTSLSPASDADVKAYVESMSLVDPNDNVVTLWPDGNNDPKSRVIVRVEYPFKFFLPFWFGPPITLSSQSEMVISY